MNSLDRFKLGVITFALTSIVLYKVGCYIDDNRHKVIIDNINDQHRKNMETWERIINLQNETEELLEKHREQLRKKKIELCEQSKPTRQKSNYEKIYEEFVENRRRMMNGEL